MEGAFSPWTNLSKFLFSFIALFFFILSAPADPPAKVSSAVISSTKANVSWTPPKQQVDSYDIEARPVNREVSRKKRATGLTASVPGNASHAVMNNLQPYTFYVFGVTSIVSFNGKTTRGASTLPSDGSKLDALVAVRTWPARKCSHVKIFNQNLNLYIKPTLVFTVKEMPYLNSVSCTAPSAPRNLSIKIGTKGTVDIFWLAPLHKDGLVQNYILEFWGNGQGVKQISSKTESQSLEVQNDVIYSFRVCSQHFSWS